MKRCAPDDSTSRASAYSCASTSTCRSTDGRSPTTRASAPPCPPSRYLLAAGRAVVLMSHLGRPKGKVVPESRSARWRRASASCSAAACALADDCIGPRRARRSARSATGRRAAAREPALPRRRGEERRPLRRELAALADVYVNDAFGTAHRAHASTAGVPALRAVACAGLLMEQGARVLGRARSATPRGPSSRSSAAPRCRTRSACIEALLTASTRCSSAAPWPTPSSPPRAYRSAQSLVDGRQAAARRRSSPTPKARSVAARCSSRRTWSRRRDRRRRGTQVGRCDGIPADKMALDIGPRDERRVLRQSGRRDDLLERPDGRLRDRRLRQRHHGRRPRRWPRRPPSPWSAAATRWPRCSSRPGRPHRPRLHGRRGVAGVPRGPALPGVEALMER